MQPTVPSHALTPTKYISRTDFLMDVCKGKSVLHLGCSSGAHLRARLQRGSLLHAKLAQVASELCGVDLDGESLQIMQDELGFTNLYEGDVERLSDLNLGMKFDIVLAGDLLEHISRPGAMLDGVRQRLNDGGAFVVSTVNAFGLHFQIKRWLGRYREHFEHVCFYSPETLHNLFERHGYRISQMYGAYTEPPYTMSNKMKFFVGAPLFRLFPVLAGTLVVVAEPHLG